MFAALGWKLLANVAELAFRAERRPKRITEQSVGRRFAPPHDGHVPHQKIQ
jgi:hypothetical protein